MADRRLGIFLGRDGAEAALVQRKRRGAAKVIARTRVEATAPLWDGDLAGLRPLFARLAKSLPRDARRADVAQFLSLPDPLVSEDRLGFRDLPDAPDETRELILWRLSREHRRPPESLACAWQVEKVEGDESRVLVRLIDRALLDAVTDAAGAAGFFPERIDGWAGFALNRADRSGAAAGARLWASDDWWTLMCWARSAKGADSETLVHAEWRDAAATGPAIAKKAARLAKSFALSQGAESLPLDLDVPPGLDGPLRAALSTEGAQVAATEDRLPNPDDATCVALDA